MNIIKFDEIELKATKHKLNDNGRICIGEEEICSQDLYVKEIYENMENGDEYVKIAFRDVGKKKWKTIITDRINIISNNKIVNLGRKGLDVSTTNSSKLVNYLRDITNSNKDIIKRAVSTSKMGWHGEDFIPYDKNIVYDGEDCFRGAYESLKGRGNYDEWLEEMKDIRNSLVVRLCMAASFGSVLLKKIGKKPFVIMIWGTSGDGKTVAAMCAMSIWGSPAEGDLQFCMNSTDNFYFRIADFLNNIPCFFDELQTYPKINQLDKLIMGLTEGIDRGKGKAEGGVERPKKWQNIFIMTGEQSASNYNSGGGTLNRLIEISTSEKIIKNGSKTANCVTKNYGWAGKDFINYLKNISENKLIERYNKRLEELLNIKDTEEKQAQNMALLLLADDLARECIFKEETPIKAEDVVGYMFTKKEIDISERAWEYIQNEVAINEINFAESSIEKWGRIIDNGFGIFINKNILEKILRNNGFNPRKMYKDWSNKGYLVKQADNRYSQKRQVYGINAHFVELRIKMGGENEKISEN